MPWNPVMTIKGPPGEASTIPGPTGPAGVDGHSPAVAMSGDQITIDGAIVGPHLTGPQGPPGVAPATPDTGWREITASVTPTPASGGVYIRRRGDMVTLAFGSTGWTATGSSSAWWPLPVGFHPEKPASATQHPVHGAIFADTRGSIVVVADLLKVATGTSLRLTVQIANLAARGQLTWITTDPWPSTLPGTPA